MSHYGREEVASGIGLFFWRVFKNLMIYMMAFIFCMAMLFGSFMTGLTIAKYSNGYVAKQIPSDSNHMKVD